MICYDIKRDRDMPPGYLTSKIKDETFEHAYTAISIVTFKKDLITEINETLVILNIRKSFHIYFKFGQWISAVHQTRRKNWIINF